VVSDNKEREKQCNVSLEDLVVGQGYPSTKAREAGGRKKLYLRSDIGTRGGWNGEKRWEKAGVEEMYIPYHLADWQRK
jgi:hypothetical protein